MKQSVVKQYVFLANAKDINLNSIVALDNYMAVLSAGIYELEKHQVIDISELNSKLKNIDVKLAQNMKIVIKKELPSELKYLRILYRAIECLEQKTIFNLVKVMTYDQGTNNSNHYIQDIMEQLVEDGVSIKGEKKGLFGKHSNIYKSDNTVIESLKGKLANNFNDDENAVILAFLLEKTNMLSMYYDKEEVKRIKENLNSVKLAQGSVTNMMNMMDNILLILFAVLAIFG